MGEDIKRWFINCIIINLFLNCWFIIPKDWSKEAIKAIKQCDKQRAKYHEHYADSKWGDPHAYDLVVNSSMGIDHAVSAILGFLDSINKNQ